MNVTEVIKRDGRKQTVSFDKIHKRIQQLSDGLNVDVVQICKTVIQGVFDGVHTSSLDVLAAETAACMASSHPDYSRLGGRISVSNLHKKTSSCISCIYPRMPSVLVAFCEKHKDAINGEMVMDSDYVYDYFAFKTLEKSYLLRNDSNDVIERPQTMLMRVSLGLHGPNKSDSQDCDDVDLLRNVFQTYHSIRQGRWTPATPILFNGGTTLNHLASCFLLPIVGDSIEGIFETNTRCAQISKSAGGIGFSVSNVRAAGSLIKSTNGKSNGIVPMLQCFERTARYVDQGGGKRKGAFCAYLEPWHPDIRAFLEMKKNHVAEEMRARDLFYALWIPDLFMKRVV